MQNSKKLLFICIGIVFFTHSIVEATETKEYRFMTHLIDSPVELNGLSDEEVKDNDGLVEAMTKGMASDAKLTAAKKIIKEYINDKNKYIHIVAEGLYKGIEFMEEINNKHIYLL